MTSEPVGNAFDTFMAQHPPLADFVAHANRVLWDESALNLAVKEKMRIAAAEAVGCNYCARFRYEDGEGLVLDGARDFGPREEQQAEAAVRFVEAVVAARGGVDDELTIEMQTYFTPEEFADLVMTMGWFIGTQHIGRLMHWDNSCPVAPILRGVEAGELA